MQVAPSGGQTFKFELFQLKDLLKLWNQYPGSVVPLAMFKIALAIFRFIREILFVAVAFDRPVFELVARLSTTWSHLH